MTDQRNANLDLLLPAFRSRLTMGVAQARKAGLDVYVFEAWRSPVRQTELYAEGRQVPGGIVTDAPAWESWHQFGVAADLVFGGPGKWTWEGDYGRLGPILEAQGLEWYGAPGAKFHELPHFEFTAGLTIGEANAIMKTDGLLGVWAAIMAKTVA